MSKKSLPLGQVGRAEINIGFDENVRGKRRSFYTLRLLGPSGSAGLEINIKPFSSSGLVSLMRVLRKARPEASFDELSRSVAEKASIQPVTRAGIRKLGQIFWFVFKVSLAVALARIVLKYFLTHKTVLW